MRVTNAMLSNNMILGLNKNMGKLNTLYDQMNSLKKIQRPSDDPIILGRSLKLRLNVLETEQYTTNVSEARSWMEISEASIKNTQAILNDIRYQCSQAANGTLEVDDRQKIMTTIEQLRKQLIQEANANYAGRNVFGGYKTDKKVLFDKDQVMDDPIKFEQKFTKDDIETVSYREEKYYRVRLPYGDVKGTGFPPGLTVTSIKSDASPPPGPPIESYYHPEPGQAYFMEDTGELIIHEDNFAHVDGATIEYNKTNFKEGDPNPELFFDVKPPTPPATESIYTDPKPSQKIEYEVGIGTKLDINILGKDLFNPLSLRDIDELVRVLESYDTVEEDIKGKEGQEPTRNPKETINLSKLFSGGMGKMDEALKTASGQRADLGSRMQRLELTEKRLADDKVSYTELLSRTEDVELEQAFIDFNTQYAVYQSALQATSKVIMPTLMDFLR